MTQRRWLRAGAGVTLLAAATLSCTLPEPFTYPLQLTPPRDATAEVQRLAVLNGKGGLSWPGPPHGRLQYIANNMSGVKPGCEVFVVARVVWVMTGETARAAIESRGTCDDSIGGGWYEVTMEGDDQVGWTVASATRSDVCRRGVSGTLCV
jgi:hypothetical protein